jgi:hypothetical protein
LKDEEYFKSFRLHPELKTLVGLAQWR